MASSEYPKTAINKLGRLPKRGAYDFATVHGIINAAPVLHVSFNDPEQAFPVVLPMLGCTGKFENQGGEVGEEQDVYIHGIMDGLVLALAPFHNSCNYRSAVAYGYSTLVTDEEERLYAMTRITNSLLPDRWENSRNPPTNAELKSTSILRVRIVSASAKVRTGGPSDDRKDLKDETLRGSVWTGVVPCWLQWGEVVEGKDNGAKKDAGIERWRVQENERNRDGAYKAVEEGG
ncbi:hypothetical protein SLS60_007152 [Paraconiothyrium brasiliense]|uniref:5-nitroimidazole antibiotic resistance protein n=1 Tax=Paraconiothyrium brasiliense TaxID=300254 RepID=A0ABR3R9C1_9PLEO